MHRLVILGDSLGMPTGVRSEKDPGAVELEESYPYLLRGLLPSWDVVSACRRSNRTDKQARFQDLSDDILLNKPTAVVVHLGINDCAPRLFSRYESFAVSQLPAWAREPIVGVASRHRLTLTRLLPKVYVKPQRFRQHVRRILEIVRQCGARPIIVGIADTNVENKRRSFGYEANIIAYNTLLRECQQEAGAPFIDVFAEGDRVLLPDGIHLNHEGCAWLADRIARTVLEAHPT